MAFLSHLTTFFVSAAVIWFFAGILVDAVARIAKRFNKTGFVVAFFILGFLTSISEISVAINSSLQGVPEVSVGNLTGATMVLLVFLIPLLAFAGKGIELKHTLSGLNLFLALLVSALPVLLLVDGDVTRSDGLLALIAYATLLFAVKGQRDSLKEVKVIEEGLLQHKHTTLKDASKILFGALAIFIAGRFLVEQAVYFAETFSIPNSLIGLLLLSLGTNVPEITLAIRSIMKGRKDIAFGDYIGSAATNTPIFGALAFLNPGFPIEPKEFYFLAFIFMIGVSFLFMFARTEKRISRFEGAFMLALYGMFLISQTFLIYYFLND